MGIVILLILHLLVQISIFNAQENKLLKLKEMNDNLKSLKTAIEELKETIRWKSKKNTQSFYFSNTLKSYTQ